MVLSFNEQCLVSACAPSSLIIAVFVNEFINKVGAGGQDRLVGNEGYTDISVYLTDISV